MDTEMDKEMHKSLDLHHESNHFFDDIFSQVDRQIARMHHDMRNAMFRLAPMDLVSSTNQELEDRLCQLRNVFCQSEDGSRQLNVTLDMSSFKPEEIEVKVKDNLLTVIAKHEEKDEHSYVKNEFHRQFTLPAGTDVDQIKSSLSKDGVLAIKGPVAAVEEAKTIPITQGDS